MTIGDNIRKARGQITQEDFAEMIGVNTVTVSRWENDKSTPNAKKLSEIAQALNTSVESLTGNTSNEGADMEHTITGGTDGDMFIINAGGTKYYFPNNEEGRKMFMTFLVAGIKGTDIPLVSNSITGDNNSGNQLGLVNQ